MPPAPSGATVRREHLIALLADRGAPPVTALIAPPGYGKTTLLADWAAQEPRPVAWLTVTDLDNDPVHLLTDLIAAYRTIGPVDPTLEGRLPSGSERLLAGPLPRLLASLSAWTEPAVLVLDDVHRVVDTGALDILSILLDRHPLGFRVALAGRSSPDLPFARLRAQRMLQEIGTVDLALDTTEAAELVRLAGAELPPQVVRDLTLRTEGWAAGIYLAVIGRAEAGDPLAVGTVSGSDRYIAEYLRSEVGRALASDDLEFLTQTAILETVTPGAALAVTGLDRPGERLERLAAANLLIAPVPGNVVTYRYHNVLREYLGSELDRRDPAAAAVAHTKAAAYYATSGMDEQAIEHALASRDLDMAARYLAAAILPLYHRGQGALLVRWLDRFSVRDLERAPMLAATGAWLYLLEGSVERAEILGDITERTDPATLGRDADAFRPLQAILRATLGRHGFADYMASARQVLADSGVPRQWRSAAAVHLGIAYLYAPVPDLGAADAMFTEAREIAPATAAGVHMTAAAFRAAIRLRRGEIADAVPFAARAREALATIDGTHTVASLMVHAVDARVRGAHADIEGAREALVRAQIVRPLATHVAPWQSVPALLELARAYLAASDLGGAQTALRHAEDIVRRRPGLGGLVDELLELRRRLIDASDVLAGSSTLTTAELRVLPLLPTYLSFEEIGERLNVSRNTVKTHAMSIYGKLWASSRGEAVERAVALGLLEPYPVLDRRIPGADKA
jgi:LuxR family maltose regulon positive regulatory protein